MTRASTVSRWWAGRHGGRHGHAGLLVPGLLTAATGMTILIWVADLPALIAGMCPFGPGARRARVEPGRGR